MIALDVLRRDAHRLTPAAARVAQGYITAETMTLPDVWRSALLRTLESIGGPSVEDHEETVRTLGSPRAWTRNAYVGEWVELRCWLAGVEAMAAQHATSPSPIG